MITPAAPLATPATPANPAQPAADDQDITFSDVLSALNPLQYLPVVGTIYRAVTGDHIPEPLRLMGSFVASGLMGGPVGLAISAGSALIQHLVGINLDDVAHDVLASAGLVEDTPVQKPATASPQAAIAAYTQTLYTYGPGAGHA